MKILVVDDQPSQINLMERQLSQAGYRTIGCCSGEEAIDKLVSHKVDMIITDMDMGGITGEHVLTHVRKRFGLLPVILMSGDPDNLRRKGFDGYLTKPFSAQQLLTAVKNARKRIDEDDKIMDKLIILMADDDPDDRTMLEEAYKSANLKWDLIFAENGIEVMEYLRGIDKYNSIPCPHIILLDLNMPFKDGKETLKEIKNDDKLKHIPIVMFTTSKSEEDIYFCYNCGAASFVTKPFAFDELIEFVKSFNRYWSEIANLPKNEFCYRTLNSSV